MVVEQVVWFLCFLGVWLFCSSVVLPIVSSVDLSEPRAEATVATGYGWMGSTELTDRARVVLDPSRVHRSRRPQGRVVLHRGLRVRAAASVVVLRRCDPEFGENAGQVSA